MTRSRSWRTAPSLFAAENRMFASRKILIRDVLARGLLLPAQDFLELGLGLVKLADALVAVHLHGKRDRRPQQQSLRRRFGDEQVFRFQAERLAQLRRQRDHAAA